MSTSCYLLGLISKAIAAPVHAKAQSSFIFFTRGQGHKTWIEMIMLSLYYSTFLYSLLTTSFPKCVFPKGIKGKICFCLLDSEQFLGSPEEQKSFCIAQFWVQTTHPNSSGASSSRHKPGSGDSSRITHIIVHSIPSELNKITKRVSFLHRKISVLICMAQIEWGVLPCDWALSQAKAAMDPLQTSCQTAWIVLWKAVNILSLLGTLVLWRKREFHQREQNLT